MPWLQDPDQSNVEYLNNEIDELETNRKTKNIRNLLLLISVVGSNIENKFLIIFSLFY